MIPLLEAHLRVGWCREEKGWSKHFKVSSYLRQSWDLHKPPPLRMEHINTKWNHTHVGFLQGIPAWMVQAPDWISSRYLPSHFSFQRQAGNKNLSTLHIPTWSLPSASPYILLLFIWIYFELAVYFISQHLCLFEAFVFIWSIWFLGLFCSICIYLVYTGRINNKILFISLSSQVALWMETSAEPVLALTSAAIIALIARHGNLISILSRKDSMGLRAIVS